MYIRVLKKKQQTKKTQQSNAHGILTHVIEDLINYEYTSTIKD